VYVACGGGEGILAVNALTYAIEDTIAVGQFPIGLAITPDGSKLYVANAAFGETTVSVIGTATNTVIATITVGLTPSDVEISPDGGTAYVSNYEGNSVSVINTATNTVTTTIPVGIGPGALAVHPNGSALYVQNGGGSTVSVVSTATNTVTDSIQGLDYGLGMAISPSGDKLYVLTPFTTGGAAVVNTVTHAIDANISIGFPLCYGNFIGGVDLTSGIAATSPGAIGVTAFPNPFTERATLRFDQELRGATVLVSDALTRTVRTAGNVSGPQWTLERQGLTAGLYTVRIAQTGTQVRSIKVTVE